MWRQKIFQCILNMIGWRISGTPPNEKKYIIIVAPHTSNVDFILGIVAKFAIGLKVKYLGKEILFQAPWGWIFYQLGGYPVKRGKHYNQVDYIVKIINKESQFILGIAPEGTRSNTGQWKTGFYWIAKLAKIPIAMVSFDYAKKNITFSTPFYPTANMEEDISRMKSFYRNVKGMRQIN
ncbi:MAG: acyltransferase [Desulfobacula sp.]|uniref:1-acyl-sn-glycerol-3-phosphate acyltransferase n=1 Tax=Desulfobacula sp. TaxID=2593537 RepID=UPI001DED69BB|nr:acyltransferase [Desulfobacula sp.]MBT3804877.1 acyltransferase [Desulfobacula sp.]MBT4508163.1 acyltransferase [Desulfobacula sp.]MBT5547255.1 acyltransferase [Desulfobacula sp.]MBT5972626.1 acyltransferase [Desulfobacula sp.]